MGHCQHCHSYKVPADRCSNCGRMICQHCAEHRDLNKACFYTGGYIKRFGEVMQKTPARLKEDAIAANFETPSNYEQLGEADQ